METYTIPEAAEITGLAPREVRVALENGRLRAVRTGGRWRIPRYELERAGMVASAEPAPASGPPERAPEAEPEPEPFAAVTALPPPAEEPAPSEEEVGDLHARLADLERRLEQLEGIADRDSREASMREALAPLFSELDHPDVERPPGATRFREPR
jgi:excisionase family DNA binding protein